MHGPNGHDGAVTLRGALPYLVRTAGRAPSPANSQPWRFRTRADAVEILVDQQRLSGEGPEALRQATIACGAGLFNLRLAVGHLGRQPEIDISVGGDLLARVRAGAHRAPEPDEERLLASINRRHTHRDAFDPEPVPDQLVARLSDAVRTEGAQLLERTDGPGRRALDAEVAASVRDDDPVAAAGLRADWVPATAGEPSRVLVLVTDTDDRTAWLQAGQALQHLLLEAAAAWVFARLATAALEDAQTRQRVHREICDGAYPQMILQVGYARIAPATPRSPVEVDLAAG
jgi:hypothetical protein